MVGVGRGGRERGGIFGFGCTALDPVAGGVEMGMVVKKEVRRWWSRVLVS